MSTWRESIRVLHVDDQPDFTETTRAYLERQDNRFTVETATKASEALDLLVDEEFDCLVSDHDMPGRNGIELLEAVREEYPDLPFILFTGKGSEEVASKAISSGVTDYLQKKGGTEQYELLAARITTAVGQYRAERKLERQNALFEKAQAIADVGAWQSEVKTDRPSYFTDQILRIHGLPPDRTLSPEESLSYYHEADRDTVRQSFKRALEEGESYEVTARLITEDGALRWVRTSGEPQTEGEEVVRVRGTLQDVTEHKERERELERQNERLEEFAHVVSHDIQTPLQVATTHLDLAQRTGEDEHFEKVADAHDQIQELIDDILTLAQQGLRIDDTESVDVDTVVRDVWRNLDTDTLSLRTVGNLRVEADPARLRQLLQNLLRNAAEQGDEDVTVSVGPIEGMPTTTRAGDTARFGFYVEDDGPGIPEDERDDVFEPGYTTSEDGTGFGLAIVEQVALAHGWDIRVIDGLDGGARFEITGVESANN
jgi:PAS domain S-box-containing protein